MPAFLCLRFCRAWSLPAIALAVIAATGGTAAGAKAGIESNRDIRPILSRNCFACHGPDEHDRRGGLRLDDRAAATSELESGLTAIVPGKPAESELVARIRTTDADIVMPPPESNHVLAAAQDLSCRDRVTAVRCGRRND